MGQLGIDIAGVVKKDSADVLADQREAQLDIVKQQRVSAQWKAGGGRLGHAWTGGNSDIARPGLVFGESAVGLAAASVESLGQRDRVGRRKAGGNAKREDHAE